MKKILTWILLFQKRILKKPMFQITILLIPILLFLLFTFNKSSDSLVRVALISGNDEYSQNFVKDLLDSSNHVISYYQCYDESQMRKDVLTGKAECGYIMPDDMPRKIAQFSSKKKQGIITAIVKKESISTKIVNEIIYGRLFSERAYPVLKDFINEKQPDRLTSAEDEKMYDAFSKYLIEPLMFSFEYADGSKNDLLNNDDSSHNYYMLPVRGILSVLILVSSMSGVLMLSNDDRKNTWGFIRLSKRPAFNYFYIFMSILPIAICSLAAIFITGISTNVLNEIRLMVLYTLLLTGFSSLLKALIKNIYVLCSLIPVTVLLSLIICPVFIDIGSIVPQSRFVRLFLPTNYYLDSIYSGPAQLKMFILAILVSLLAILKEMITARSGISFKKKKAAH
ncbi:MAG: hypothetical protein EGR89_09810 [[Eubacterium] rectale]|nr:hypothetical protein [Agathobacter rectalis]